MQLPRTRVKNDSPSLKDRDMRPLVAGAKPSAQLRGETPLRKELLLPLLLFPQAMPTRSIILHAGKPGLAHVGGEETLKEYTPLVCVLKLIPRNE